MRSILSSTSVLLMAGVLLTGSASTAFAADVYLRAESFGKVLPDGTSVPMWGFAQCQPDWVECALPTAPGPQIALAPSDALTVHLENALLTPVSIVVPGQSDGGDPVWITDALGRRRVQSFTHETAPGARSDYTWGSPRVGTYLYQSGTHPSIQVPMGLYGAFVVGPATGVACPTGAPAYDSLESCHDADAVLVFSEIDPWLNAAIDAAGGDPAAYPSTIDYQPSWFLVNGDASAPFPAGNPGDNVLLRLLNAGLQSHTPAIVGLDMGILAEDGYPYPGLPRQQSHALLPAGKTLDVVVPMPAADATYSLFDRMAQSSVGDLPGGGLLAELEVGTGSTAPTQPTVFAVDDSYVFSEDTSTLVESVLANDEGLAGATVTVVIGPSHGELDLLPDGTFTYSPDPDFAGTDGFTYSANDGTDSYAAQVTLDVLFFNDAPVSADDGPYVNAIGPDVTVDAPGVLGNDADPDGDTLTAVLDTPPDSGTLTLNPDGSFSYVGGTPGSTVSFAYHATDGVSSSDPAIVTLTVNPVANIALTVQDPLGAAVTGYRWLVQEDATFHVDPTAPPPLTETLSTGFHESYMPVVAQGSGADVFAQVALDPERRYYVSVLPDDAGTDTGQAIGGAQIPPGTTALNVLVNNAPIQTAQISVLVFEDNQPTNGAPDPGEPGMGGFQVTLVDAGGRYGISGGAVSQDAFGQPLKNSADCFGGAEPPMGVIVTCPDGSALIKDLPPGKYGVVVDAPAGTGEVWTQTATIEGTRTVDAWVQAGEPPYFLEFGGPGYHTWFGFVNPAHTQVPEEVPAEARTNTIEGSVTNLHLARAPSLLGFDSGSYDALGFTRAWVGLNSTGGDGPNFATVQADENGHFEIAGIPDGLYQLVVWDNYLDQIIAFQAVTLSGGALDLGNIPVLTWFTRLEHNVFLDTNEDGVRQDGETGLPEQLVNLRFRDGSVYQSFPTDMDGFVPFDEVFPFFAWQVAEVDYTRFKPTGVTVTVDGGGDVSAGPYPGLLNPQVGSPRTDTEPAPMLLQGFQGIPGQTNIFEWGKAPYAPGENGGISGVVYYASTRGENDPRLTVGDPWEGGLPGVKVRLYREIASDFDGGTALALVQEVETDSWDASTPTDCAGELTTDNPFVDQTLDGDAARCFDGWRNWNQVRPAVFDGGYAFTDIPPGTYVVEVVPPPGFELVKEEDKNVDFGDVFATAPVDMMLPSGAMITVMPDAAMVLASTEPEPGIAQPACVGEAHPVPYELSLFPGVETYTPFAGTERPLCDRKEVVLADQGQAAADFHLFTSTPVAAQFYGLVTDDIANETNPAAPGFGEKFSPAFMPVSMRDFNGHEVYRGYTDAFGTYNGLVPSTISANLPMPSGYSPAMYSTCVNDPGDGATPDPLRNPSYAAICYTYQFMPRTTTYLDTPVLPQAAFAAGFDPVDCAPAVGTPVVTQVDGTGTGPLVASGGTLTIRSAGLTSVPNPAYEGPTAAAPWNEPLVQRDLGFGSVRGTVTVNGTPLINVSWSDGVITGTLRRGNNGTGELVVTRGDNGEVSVNTVTVTVGTETPIRVTPGPGAIQAAIDAAPPGALILVEPGVYDELVVMWKPVRLQGAGGGSTIIRAFSSNAQQLEAWRTKVQGLVDSGAVDLLPGEPTQFDVVGGGLFGTELGAGITVLAKNDGSFGEFPSRIDGLTVTGAQLGGGIFVNGYAHDLEISNNVVTGNAGTLHGGIRVGKPFVANTGNGPFGYNTNVQIHHNSVTLNGGVGEQGVGGVSLNTGADDYRVSENFVCGNFTQGDGGGVAHFGLSDGGRIDHNEILFNQSFLQGQIRSGGGLYIAGEPDAGTELTLGTGDVTVEANLVLGNQAGAGHGGGVRTERVNGNDVELSPSEPANWHRINILNNMIVNNVAGWSGAGISLQDTANAVVLFNTVANNDSTATVGDLFDATAGTSTPQPAGISSAPHSPGLDAAIPVELASRRGFSNPTLTHNILWHNRAFSLEATATDFRLVPDLAPSAVGDCPAGATYWDHGVLDPAFALDPRFSLVTDGLGFGNFSSDPEFLSEYCNGARSLSTPGPIHVFASLEEGGNFLDVRYGPLTLTWPVGDVPWNYHVADTSPVDDFLPLDLAVRRLYQRLVREGNEPFTSVRRDFDADLRRNPVDVGADEVVP